ncbi:MAG: AAA family ATPase, partial [Bacteroidales bacterium]
MEFLSQQHRRGMHALLIIDEAQDLSREALEEIRLLNNLQHGGQPLLQIILLGQEGLRELFRRPEMEQVHQRLIAAWHLEPLSPEETMQYVQRRLEAAGWKGDPVLEPGVLPVVYEFSGGVPRRINLVCSRLFLHAFLAESHSITPADAEEADRRSSSSTGQASRRLFSGCVSSSSRRSRAASSASAGVMLWLSARKACRKSRLQTRLMRR